ncbi:glycosyltransferase family 39 protein [candidate division KSB1 bacterium]|nr:glycosyltransferase family 39 protein [candidate division KSB1 bacterium]
MKTTLRKNSILTFIIVSCIIALAFGIRYLHLVGDPPVADISRSGVFYMDEGTYAHNVVNKILFGTWFIPNEYNAIANTPVFSIFQYIVLKSFGVSLVSLRTGGILYAILFLLILWVTLRNMNPYGALLALVLGSINYFLFIYNRLALLENMLLLVLMLITLFLFFYMRRQQIIWLISAIILFWAGYFIKATILFFLPLIILTIILQPLPLRRKLKHLWVYFSVSSIILVLLYFIWVKPFAFDWQYFQARNIHRMIGKSTPILLINYGRYLVNLKLFQFMPVMYTIALFYIGILGTEFFNKKKLPFWDWYFVAWYFCGILFLGFFAYSPPRFSLILMPALLVLMTRFFIRTYTRDISLSRRALLGIFVPLGVLILCQIGFGIFRIIAYDTIYLSCFLPLLSIPALIVLFYLQRNKTSAPRIVFGLIASILIINAVQIFEYFHTIKYSYYTAIMDMKKVIEAQHQPENILMGDIASLVSIELRMKAVNINFRSDTEVNRILQNEPNLMILQDKKELDRLTHKLPDYLSNVQLIKTYKILDNYVTNDDTYFYRIQHNHEKSKMAAFGSDKKQEKSVQ